MLLRLAAFANCMLCAVGCFSCNCPVWQRVICDTQGCHRPPNALRHTSQDVRLTHNHCPDFILRPLPWSEPADIARIKLRDANATARRWEVPGQLFASGSLLSGAYQWALARAAMLQALLGRCGCCPHPCCCCSC